MAEQIQIEQLLKQYSLEIGLENTISINMLIDSHRTLRVANQENTKKLHDQIQKGREIGIEQGRQLIANGEYIEVKKLKSMTVQELINFLGNE